MSYEHEITCPMCRAGGQDIKTIEDRTKVLTHQKKPSVKNAVMNFKNSKEVKHHE